MDEELEAQAEATLDVIRAAVVRLLRDGGVRPQLVALAVARVAGELGASVAVADGGGPGGWGGPRRRGGRRSRSRTGWTSSGCWASWPTSRARPTGSITSWCSGRR